MKLISTSFEMCAFEKIATSMPLLGHDMQVFLSFKTAEQLYFQATYSSACQPEPNVTITQSISP